MSIWLISFIWVRSLDVPTCKSGDHKSYRNGDINFYTNSYINTLGKAELTTSTRHIAILLKSGIPMNDSEVPDSADKKNEKKNDKKMPKCN